LSVTVELPHVGESVVEGTIGKWLKQPGDKLERFEPMVEVITDKVTMEVPSPVNGSLLQILAQEGETLPMGAPIAEVESIDAVESERPVVATPAASASTEQATPVGTIGYLVKDVRPVGPTGGDGASEIAPLAPDAAPQTTPRPTPMPTAVASNQAPGGAARPSPAVRRLAREHNLDLSQVTGTGLGGRITREDVLRYAESKDATSAVAPAAAQAPITPASTSSEADEQHVPLTPVRRMIAEAMVRSVTQIPHAWSTVEVDVSNLVALRNQIRTDFEQREGIDLTYLPFAVKAVVESLKEHPTLNAAWGGDKIILKRRINLGIAVAAPQGLIVPVIHDADRLSVAGLASVMSDLVQRARQNKLTVADVEGGTFTLNNTGALGSTTSYPIINYPQAAILTTEAIQKRPVVRDDAIAIRSMMNICMSFDHRINDGAESGAFLRAVKSHLEAIGSGTSIY
jgi:2-oxoisovalerate dehydrogenase E2 component (dihydrolipoyl transacylase)